MQNPIIKRINAIMHEQKLNRDVDFAERIGISVETFRTMIKRGSNPKVDVILKISSSFEQYSLHWLLTGKGEMHINRTPILFDKKTKGAIPYYADLPISAGQAGLSQTAQE